MLAPTRIERGPHLLTLLETIRTPKELAGRAALTVSQIVAAGSGSNATASDRIAKKAIFAWTIGAAAVLATRTPNTLR